MRDAVHCRFYVREPRDNGQWRYRSVWINSWDSGGCIVTPYPPLVGDIIRLWDQDESGPRGTFEVISRQWLHSSYGSVNWPPGKQESTVGPELMVIVVPAEGVIRDEAELTDAEKEEMGL